MRYSSLRVNPEKQLDRVAGGRYGTDREGVSSDQRSIDHHLVTDDGERVGVVEVTADDVVEVGPEVLLQGTHLGVEALQAVERDRTPAAYRVTVGYQEPSVLDLLDGPERLGDVERDVRLVGQQLLDELVDQVVIVINGLLVPVHLGLGATVVTHNTREPDFREGH